MAGDRPAHRRLAGVYLGTIFEAGRAPATAALAVAAVRFRAKLAGQADPAGERTARVLGGYRRTAADRGRGQAKPRCARTGSPRFSPPPPGPARTAGASNPIPRRTAGADSTP